MAYGVPGRKLRSALQCRRSRVPSTAPFPRPLLLELSGMDAARRTYIASLAETIRQACAIGVPADVRGAVTCLGGTLRVMPDPGFEAMVEKCDAGFRITLAEEPIEARQRFSIAHELGHLFLHMGYLVDEKKWASITDYRDSVYYRFGYTEEEYEANEFAAALLMPSAEFDAVARRYALGTSYDVTAIARHFGVSAPAARVRGRFLGLFTWE